MGFCSILGNVKFERAYMVYEQAYVMYKKELFLCEYFTEEVWKEV